ncbi:hypothetical protein MW887_005668 [Aspergillus wentii]|nr:hypothetical protein MW887_005668 [Aspergillus wentii]
MDTISGEYEDPGSPLLKPSALRVLVQTLTHFVPADGRAPEGDLYSSKLMAMLDRICQHHWNCDFQPGVQRFYSYGDEFGYNNRRCFFLVDYGTSDNDDDVPILCYEWTGESFKPTPQLLQNEEVQAELKDIPFTPGPDEPYEKPPVPRTVRRRLRKAQAIPNRELEHLMVHPEDMEWLERKVKPRFWANLLGQIERRRKEKEEIDILLYN